MCPEIGATNYTARHLPTPTPRHVVRMLSCDIHVDHDTSSSFKFMVL